MRHWRVTAATATMACAAGVASPKASAATVYADDFSKGLDPVIWRTQKTVASYIAEASQGGVRLASMGLVSNSYQADQVYFRGIVNGDFDMQISFHDAQLALHNFSGQAANQIALHVQVGSQHFAPTRDVAVVEGDNAHVYANPPGATFGVTPTNVTQGAFRLTRVGSTYAGYFNGAKLYENTYSSVTPSDLWFSLENNQTSDDISVIYDDFSITAGASRESPSRRPPEPSSDLQLIFLQRVAGVNVR